MKDPYVLENGTLKNLLGIEDGKELEKAEADIGFSKLIDVNSAFLIDYDDKLFRSIHKHIFSDIYEWAGQYRTTPIYKEEVVIPGLSLEYTEPAKIQEQLKRKLEDLNNTKWKDLSLDELSLQFAKKLAAVWRVHPFRDGNTRTTLAFADMYSRANGFPLNMEYLLDKLVRKTNEQGKITQYSVRDFFVLAALDEKDYPEPEHLAFILKKAIERGALPKLNENKTKNPGDQR